MRATTSLIGSDAEFGFNDLNGEDGNDDAASRSRRLEPERRQPERTGCSAARATTRWSAASTSTRSSSTATQDLFVYTGTGRWSEEFSFFGDQIDQFEDGIDKIDLRGSGLQYSDLTIDNEGEFGPMITSDRGQITVGTFGVVIDETDFLFDDPPASMASGGGDLFLA